MGAAATTVTAATTTVAAATTTVTATAAAAPASMARGATGLNQILLLRNPCQFHSVRAGRRGRRNDGRVTAEVVDARKDAKKDTYVSFAKFAVMLTFEHAQLQLQSCVTVLNSTNVVNISV